MAIGTDDQRLPMHLFYRVCYVVFFKVAIEMDDQRLPIYLFLSDIDDEVVVVVDRSSSALLFSRLYL